MLLFINAGPVLPGGEAYRGRWALLHLREQKYTNYLSRVILLEKKVDNQASCQLPNVVDYAQGYLDP